MKAYKAFNSDWTCRGFQFEMGKTYTLEEEGPPILCQRGFHACMELADCLDYYPLSDNTKFAEVELLGTIAGSVKNNSKVATTKIRLVREITYPELATLINSGTPNFGYKNVGNYNTGHHNTGHCNTGHHNTGHRNTGNTNIGEANSGYENKGNRNTGNYNAGSRNTGNYNSGSYNTGEFNLGNKNSGNSNPGNRNSGNRNSGHGNSGDSNQGNLNSGDHNIGSFNTGQFNTGNFNSGDSNIGHRNSGDYNLGDRNTGDYNSISDSNGYFNTKPPLIIEVFNKPCFVNTWDDAIKPKLLQISLTEFVPITEMTEAEKKAHPHHKTLLGYKRFISYRKAWINSWNKAADNDKQLLYALPNFDPKVFEEITGIDVTQDPTWSPA